MVVHCAVCHADLQKPATLEEAIKVMVAVRLEEEKKVLSAEYASKEVRRMVFYTTFDAGCRVGRGSLHTCTQSKHGHAGGQGCVVVCGRWTM